MRKPRNSTSVLTAAAAFILLWVAQANADNLYYQVFRSQSQDPATAEVIAARVSQTHFTDTDVVEGTRYYYWVKATVMTADFHLDSFPEPYPHYQSTLYLLAADKTKIGQLTPLILLHEIENLTQDIHEITLDYTFDRTDISTDPLDHVTIDDVTIHPIMPYNHELNVFYRIAEYKTEPATFQGSVRWQYVHYNHPYDFIQFSPQLNSELVYVLPAGPAVTAQAVDHAIELTWTAKTETTDWSEAAPGRIPTTIYVNHAGTPEPEDGTSWQTAYIFLQDALLQAEYGDTIYVAAPALGNRYYPDLSSSTPTGSGDRAATFQIPNGVKVYGGFPTHGSDMDQRDPDLYPTPLSGDINSVGIESDNSYHVVTITECDATTLLDGFVIESGYANTLDPHDRGAGLFIENSDAVIRHCTLRYHTAIMAAGIYCKQSSPAVLNCLFWDNRSGIWGGGAMYNEDSDPVVQNCRFILNTATMDVSGNGGNGGAIYNESSTPVLTNCEFKCNTAKKNGGGIYNWDSEPELINCTFSGNLADADGGGMCSNETAGYFSLATIINCIFWGNRDENAALNEYTQIAGYQPLIYNSCVQDETAGDGDLPFSGAVYDNIDSHPKFVTDPDPGPDGQWDGVDDCIGDLKLQYDSACIETGDNAFLPADGYDLDNDDDTTEPVPLDAAGHPRCLDNDNDFTGTIDMGAYERGVCPGNPDLDDSGLVNLNDFAMLAEQWLETGCDCYSDCCGQRDLNGDDNVSAEDLMILSENWLSSPLDEGLVAYYPFDGNCDDVVGGHGGCWNDSGTNFTEGMKGQSYRFSEGYYFTAGTIPEIDNVNQLTVSIWFKGNNTHAHGETIVSKGKSTEAPAFQLWLSGNDDPQLYTIQLNSVGGQYNSTAPYYIADTLQWHHYALVYDGDKAKAYVDGVLVDEIDAAIGLIDTTGHNLYINRHTWSPSSWSARLRGQVDEFRLYSRPLSQNEIQKLYLLE